MTDPTDRDREMAEGYYHDADPLYRLDAVPRLAKLFREARAEGRRAAFEEWAKRMDQFSADVLTFQRPGTENFAWNVCMQQRHEDSKAFAEQVRALAAKEQT